MSSDVVIAVANVSKTYTIWSSPSARLQIIAGILTPTSGSVAVRGKVAAGGEGS